MAAKNVYVDYNFNNNKLSQLVIEGLATDPAGTTGRLYFHNAEKRFRYYDGTKWGPLSIGKIEESTDFEGTGFDKSMAGQYLSWDVPTNKFKCFIE